MVVLEGGDIFAEDFINQEMLNAEREKMSDIQRFFDGANVLITGGTGFLGKTLIEKLFRTCSKLNRIYLLMRPKKDKDIRERYEEQFMGPLFDKLKLEYPSFQSKVTVVSGDCSQPDIGLNCVDQEMLINNINIVFHAAATVRFDETLRRAVIINVCGTKCLLDLARKMKNLKSFIHISTAYSNCPNKEILEKFYPPPLDYTKAINLIDCLDDNLLEVVVPELLGKWPNTYTFTKAIAEDVIKEYGKGLPIAIFRPSIVISTAKEPIAGWVNNLYGPQGVVFGAGIGLLRTLHCKPYVVADMVPVDFVVNAMIALAWNIAITRGDNPNFEKPSDPYLQNGLNNWVDKEEIPILNFVSSEKQPITWKDFMHYNHIHGAPIPPIIQVWYYSFSITQSYYLDLFYRWTFHMLPAAITDTLAYCVGKKPMLWNAYKKIHKFSKVISHFSTQQWKFKDNNVTKLWSKLSPKDKELFDFDVTGIDWDTYFYTYIRGLRMYMANDDMSTVPKALIHKRRFKIAHYSLIAIFYVLLAFIFIWIYNLIF